jgi:hypothetical protein
MSSVLQHVIRRVPSFCNDVSESETRTSWCRLCVTSGCDGNTPPQQRSNQLHAPVALSTMKQQVRCHLSHSTKVLRLFVFWAGVVPNPLLPRPLNDPMYQSRMMKSVEQSVECFAGETAVPWENLPQCRSVHRRSHMTWPGLEPGPPRWEALQLTAWATAQYYPWSSASSTGSRCRYRRQWKSVMHLLLAKLTNSKPNFVKECHLLWSYAA